MEVMQGYSESSNEYKKVTERLASLAIAPWFHVLGLVNVVIMILTGQSTVVFLPKFIPELYLKSIEVNICVYYKLLLIKLLNY